MQLSVFKCVFKHQAALGWAIPLLFASAVQAQSLQIQCPASVTGQYSRLAAFAADGARGSIDGLAPIFEPRSAMRLVNPHIAVAHGGESTPSENLPPDQLSFTLGKPMKWSIWDGRPPEPSGIVHVVCEYEGGVILHKALTRTVKHCALDSVSSKPNSKNNLSREVATRAVFNCR